MCVWKLEVLEKRVSNLSPRLQLCAKIHEVLRTFSLESFFFPIRFMHLNR